MLKECIDDGVLAFGIRYVGAFNESTIGTFSIQFDLTYLDGDTLTATISNVIGGQIDYAGTGSLIRAGDDPFTSPPVQKIWEVGGNYFAETWFSQFDSLSSGMPEKLINWQSDNAKYFVRLPILDFFRYEQQRTTLLRLYVRC